jgi:hypothetical protein
MLSPDLLHQVIKGTFKDHLVTWIGEYLELHEGKAKAVAIMDDIDRQYVDASLRYCNKVLISLATRIAAALAFPGLQRFPEGRQFKQWTGDNSKALMNVSPCTPYHYNVHIVDVHEGLSHSSCGICTLGDDSGSCFIPGILLHSSSALVSLRTLDRLQEALQSFHHCQEVFCETGVCPKGFSLPCQHSLMHYRSMIEDFGAPGGLCSLIAESRHITTVKKPWRRSNRYNTLGQMLQTNQRLDKLHAMQVHFIAQKMIAPFHNMVSKENKD